MILIHNKSYEELSELTIEQLQEKGFDTTPGSIAKLFADIICKNTSDFYDKLTADHMLAFLTTSQGTFLDSIGLLLDCTRLEEESDADYKKRISYQTRSLAKANEVSIRLAILSLDGVEDVKIKRYAHGPGSMTIVPISESGISSRLNAVVSEVASETASCGERVIVKTPDFKYVKLDVNLIMAPEIDDTIKQEVAITVRSNIEKYIGSIKLGGTLIINKLTEVIMGSSSTIINYSTNSFMINNEACMLINQGSRWDEKFAISPDKASVVVR